MHNMTATKGKTNRSRSARVVAGALVNSIVIAGLLCVALLTGCSAGEQEVSEESPTTTTGAAQDTGTATPAVESVAYEVLQKKPIPAGGSARVIIIDPQDCTEARLRVLGDQLHKEAAASDTNAAVFVFDDKRAAGMYEDALADTLSKDDLAFHDQHMVGTYRRNASTGFQRFAFYTQGLNGPEALVDY